MGNASSNSPNHPEYQRVGSGFTPMNETRTREYYESSFVQMPIQKAASSPPPITTSARSSDYKAIWSMIIPDPPLPITRSAQCSIYDPLTDQIYIAYGIDKKRRYLKDCWALNLSTLKWKLINPSLLSPRMYATSILITTENSREMFIFGGFDGLNYFSDLHSINLDTGQVTLYDSKSVSPRMNACLFSSSESIIIYSGFNGQTLDTLDEFNFLTQKWERQTRIDGIRGRSAAVCTDSFDGSHWFIFGDTVGHPLVSVDTDNQSFKELFCAGFGPPAGLKHALFCRADRYLFACGGLKDSPYTYAYGLDIERQFWFVLSVEPDQETVSIVDGCVKNGMFQLPRQHSGAMAYSPHQRSIISVMGSGFVDPAPVHILRIGDALTIIHLMGDMLNMLDMCGNM